MSEDTNLLQMVRVLPMVEALQGEARLAVQGAGGVEAATYVVERHNLYVSRIAELTGDDLIAGLAFGDAVVELSNEEKMQRVVIASAELSSYLRARIGIPAGGSGSRIGTIIQSAPSEGGRRRKRRRGKGDDGEKD